MSELVLDAPDVEQPPVSGGSFDAPRPRGEAPAPAPAPAPEAPAPAPAAPAEAPNPAAPVQAPPATPAQPPAVATAPDYMPLFKELGYESKEQLAEAVAAAKQVETLKGNQRDAHDVAIREMLADPAKAQAYFALQTVQPEALAAGTPDQQRELLFSKFKIDHPEFTGRLAEIEFQDEYNAKFAAAHDEDADPDVAERAKLRLTAAVGQAVPAVKAAQEAAKVAVLPTPAPADGLTPEQRAANDRQWLDQVDAVLAKPTVEQTFQVEGQSVTAAFETKHPDYKAFMDDPLPYLEKELHAIAYPNGAKTPDMAALAQVFGRIKQPDVIAKSAWNAAIASQGATIPLATLANPAPDAPQGPTGGAATIGEAFDRARPRS